MIRFKESEACQAEVAVQAKAAFRVKKHTRSTTNSTTFAKISKNSAQKQKPYGTTKSNSIKQSTK